MSITPSLTSRVRVSPADRSIVLGLAMVVLVVLLSVIGPMLAPHEPTEIVARPFSPGTETMLLGADFLGRDVMSRLLFGGMSLIIMSLAAAGGGTLLGAAIGICAAYFKGWVSEILLRAIDVLFAFPTVVLALLFVSVFGTQPWLLVVAVTLSHVPPVARVVWGATLNVVGREHVLWSRAVGISPMKLISADVLPLVTSPLTVEFGLRLMWSIGAIAGLSFIGYGIQPPAADWGLMVSENKNGLIIQPLAVLAPIVCMGLFTLGCYMAAEGFARRIARTGARTS